ncbi:MAG: hypothetical protein WD645_03360 [Dehalococcoidia bacterium]
MPIVVDPANTKAGPDGAVGIGYEYVANGQATGGMTGSFTYVERGYIFLGDPADPASLVGSEFTGATVTVFTAGGPVEGVTIVDTCVPCYEHDVESAKLSDVPSWARGLLSRVADAQSAGAEELFQHGYFTFNTDVGEFIGYATPDFREFVLKLQFVEPAPSAEA